MVISPNPNFRRVSQQSSLAAPTGGLNARDPLAKMSETDAVVMDNYFPTPGSVDSRNGSTDHATGVDGLVETLASYNNGTLRLLFGAAGDSIYDVTGTGAVGAAEVSGLSNARFQNINFGTAGSHYLLMVNGADKMQVFDGTNWYEDGTTTTVTGFDTADAIHINNFKNRVWFVQKDSMSVWYLPVSSVGGAAAELALGGIFSLGGYLVAMANWTIDNAAGIDDYAAFITSEGEVAIYQGTDPTSAATWALKGTFRMGRPVGYRCFCKTGADVLVITTDGAFPLSKALLTDRTQMNLAATDKISGLINRDTKTYFNNFGWQPIIFPSGNKLILNVPQIQGTTSIQYVMNTLNGSWCRFTGWNASCFDVLEDRLYYGTNGKVIQADIGAADAGDIAIEGKVQQAYSYFKSGGIQKHFKLARPVLESEGIIIPTVSISVDFRENQLPASTISLSTGGATWDLADWDSSDWVANNNISHEWQSIEGVGIAGGLKMITALRGVTCKWVATDVIYEKGGSL